MVDVAPQPGLDTVPRLLARNARSFGDKPASREKEFGIWQSWTWKEQLDEVRAFAIGLQSIGVGRGDHVPVALALTEHHEIALVLKHCPERCG